MGITITIVDILNNLLLGAGGNVLYDGIKVGLNRVSKTNFEDLYIDAFEKAVHKIRYSLVRYAKEDGEIGIDRKAFKRFLFKKISVSKENTLGLNNQDIFREIAKAFADESIFFIGGNTLDSDEFTEIIETLIIQGRTILREKIIAHENIFKECILANTEATNQNLVDLNIILKELNQSVSVNFLDLGQILDKIIKKTDEIVNHFKVLHIFDVLDTSKINIDNIDQEGYGFYEGYKARWSDLLRELDIVRDQFLETIELISNLTGTRVLVVIRSTMGSGKTTFLKRLALTIAQQGNIVLYPKTVPKSLSIVSDLENIRAIYNEARKVNKDLIICLDDATRIADFDQLLEYIAEMNIKATILITSRNDEWIQNRPVLTANMELETVEIELANYWSENEAEEIRNRLQTTGNLKKVVNFAGGNVFETMWEATSGEPLRERIYARLKHIENNEQPEIMRAYEYTALLSQYGLVMPVLLIKKLCEHENSKLDIVNQLLLKEIAEYSEDVDAITVGHEQIASEIIKQRYQNAYGQRRLINDYVNIIKSCTVIHRTTVLELLPHLIEDNKTTGDLIVNECKAYLLTLRKESTPDELSKNWSTLYQMIGDIETAEECHLNAISQVKNSHFLARYAWFLRSQYRFHEAISYLNTAIEIDNDDIGAYSMLGRILKSLLLYEKASECFETALTALPDFYRESLFPHYLPILFYLRRYDEAEKVCRELINIQLYRNQLSIRFFIELIRLLLVKQDLNATETEIKNLLNYSLELSKSRLEEIIGSIPLSRTKRNELKEWANQFSHSLIVFANPVVKEHSISTEKPTLENSTPFIKASLSYHEKLVQELGLMEEDGILPYLNKLITKNKHDTAAYVEAAKYNLRKQNVVEAEKYFLACIANRSPQDFIGPILYSHFLARQSRFLESINYLRHATFIAIGKNSRKGLVRTSEFNFVVLSLLSKGYIHDVMECLHLLEEPLQQLLLTDEILDAFIRKGYFKELQFLCETQLKINNKEIKKSYIPAIVIALIKQGNYNEAKKYIREFQKNVPYSKYELIAIQACGLYLVRNRHRDASKFIGLALRDDPHNIKSLEIQSESLMHIKQYQAARKRLRQVLDLSSTSGTSYALLGQISSLEGNTIESYNFFLKGIDLQPKSSEVNAKYAFFIREEGKKFELLDRNTYQNYMNLSEEHARVAYEHAANDSYVSNIYTETLLQLGKLLLAEQVTQHILQLIPDDIHILTYAAQVKASLSNFDKAIEYFEKAIEIASAPSKAFCLGLYGKTLLSQGDFTNAYAKFTEALKYSPSGLRAQLDIANYYSARKNYDISLRYYTQALEKYPNSLEVHLGIAKSYEILGEHSKAVKELAIWALQAWKMGNITSTICSSYSAFLYQQKHNLSLYGDILFLCGVLAYYSSLSLPLTSKFAELVHKKITETEFSDISSKQNITKLKSLINDNGEVQESELFMVYEEVVKNL